MPRADRSPGRIFVAGHRGLVGSAIIRELRRGGYPEPLTATRQELDLREQKPVRDFFQAERPDVVLLAAGRVGGIAASDRYRWDSLAENLAIEVNVLQAALDTGARVIFFGSACVYPRKAPQPIREEHLLTGPLEPSNEPYAIAKIAGLKLVESANIQHGRDWISLMPANLYGPNDNFDLERSHVIPALIRRISEAAAHGMKEPLVLWGSGAPLREFLHVDDLARAAVTVMQSDVTGLFNVGSGEEISISSLATMIAEETGFTGTLEWDTSRPDGAPRRIVDSSRLRALGWEALIPLRDGIRATIAWYRSRAVAA